jgi:putative acetyltransferase
MVEIVIADLTDPRVLALLGEHLAEMRASSPPEAVFALDLDGLRRPELRLWTAWEGEQVVACGALREIGPQTGEIKSMRTARAHQGRGLGKAMLAHLLTEARRRGYDKVLLETGSGPVFAAALGLYTSAGFVSCGPFPPYAPSSFNRFFSLTLRPAYPAPGQGYDGGDARPPAQPPLHRRLRRSRGLPPARGRGALR